MTTLTIVPIHTTLDQGDLAQLGVRMICNFPYDNLVIGQPIIINAQKHSTFLTPSNLTHLFALRPDLTPAHKADIQAIMSHQVQDQLSGETDVLGITDLFLYDAKLESLVHQYTDNHLGIISRAFNLKNLDDLLVNSQQTLGLLHGLSYHENCLMANHNQTYEQTIPKRPGRFCPPCQDKLYKLRQSCASQEENKQLSLFSSDMTI